MDGVSSFVHLGLQGGLACLCSGGSKEGPCKTCHSATNSTAVDSPAAKFHGHDDTPPTWSSLQRFSFSKWASSLCRRVLATKTPFSAFLRGTLQVRRCSRVASEKALFPLPVPKEGVFETKRSDGSRCRRRKATDQAFHIAIMALNFWHSNFRFIPVAELSCFPSQAQGKVLDDLRRTFRAFGSCDANFAVPDSGRRSTNLIAQLSDLCEFLTWQCPGSGSYMFDFPGAEGGFEEVRLQADTTRAEELRPYRPLCPERIKITGQGNWDPSPFLSDALWLAYQEPESIRWRSEPIGEDVPDLSKESYADVLGLARVWDARGLLFICEPKKVKSSTAFMRFFNCYKSEEKDRLIGDRRARNQIEGAIPGASKALPPATLLAQLEVDPRLHTLSISISDRKDFYHQFHVSDQRALSNICFPALMVKDLEGTSALAKVSEAARGPKRYDRLLHGDRLGHEKASKHEGVHVALEEGKCFACFGSLPQGDHLGVEFAVDSHRSLLQTHGLLSWDAEMRADRIYRGVDRACGLVIDDFYSISVEDASEPTKPAGCRSASWAVSQLDLASKVYEAEGILGSTEKDVVGQDKAKVTGAELNSSKEVRRCGRVTLGVPPAKRLALALVSLELAKLGWTTDSLHLCLIGGWVNALLYRRPMMSIFSEVFGFVDGATVSQECPKIVRQPRSVAQELALVSVLVPFMNADLATVFEPKIYATDSSDAKGAIVEAPLKVDTVRALWRSSRKKGGYVRMITKTEALIQKLDPMFQPHLPEGLVPDETVQKPLALRFHFIEICGGAGVVSDAMRQLGWHVGPVLDLTASPHYDLKKVRFLEWVYHLLEHGLLDSGMVEPPCTTFSPAQHPASRSYSNPRGFDPQDEKTQVGTTLALRGLACVWKGSQVEAPFMLEQPRKTKMKKLSEWRFLVESGLAEEFWTASCMFGSIHNKEFIFLCAHLDDALLHRKCSRDHTHVPIQGSYTKDSATYVPKLGEAIAATFDKALKKKFCQERALDVKISGLENPFCNDILCSSEWSVRKVWRWKRPRHINIHETTAVCILLKDLALLRSGSRPVIALDSNVGLSALVKGRSPSLGLQPVLRKVGATAIAGHLFPAYHFAPTRLNPADHPTRDNPLPPALSSALSSNASLSDLLDFAEVDLLSRPAANWIRLLTLLIGAAVPWRSQEEGWRFAHHSWRHYPFWFQLRSEGMRRQMDFDATLGFPGEGPWIFRVIFWILVFLSRQAFLCALDFRKLHRPGFSLGHARSLWVGSCSGRFVGRGLLFGFCLAALLPTVRSHGGVLLPRDAGDRARAAQRGSLELVEGRPVLGKTQVQRDKLLAAFDEWLKTEGLSLGEILFVAMPDIEMINLQLERYGRCLYKAGRPYGHYSETINAIAGKRPRIRRSLQPAWDLAYAWMRQEPPVHHLALPWQAMLALVTTAFCWGWPAVAGIMAISWGGLTRIGEALSALRSQLVLPKDVEYTADYVLLQINEPKTRFRAARHQVAKVDQRQLVKVIELAFQHLKPHQRLWPFSGQTMRARFQKLLDASGLSSLPKNLSRGIDLGSLRAGGASWLMMVSEDVELTRRRGRWLTSKVLEIYVQEVSSLQFLPNLPGPTKLLIIAGASIFPWILSIVANFRHAQIPEIAWPFLIMSEAVEHEQNGSKIEEDVGGFGHISGRNGCVNHPLHLERKWGRSSSLDMLIDNIE